MKGELIGEMREDVNGIEHYFVHKPAPYKSISAEQHKKMMRIIKEPLLKAINKCRENRNNK